MGFRRAVSESLQRNFPDFDSLSDLLRIIDFFSGEAFLPTVEAFLLTVEVLCLQSMKVLIRRTFPL